MYWRPTRWPVRLAQAPYFRASCGPLRSPAGRQRPLVPVAADQADAVIASGVSRSSACGADQDAGAGCERDGPTVG